MFNEFSQELLKRHYCRPNETIEEAFNRAAVCFGSNKEHTNRLNSYINNGWFMYASPVLSNAIYPHEKPKGMPISCFLTYVPDTIDGLCEHTTEFRWLSVLGGGVGGHWTDVRSMSEMTPGAVGFMGSLDRDTILYRQGKTRRGSYAAYMTLTHPESKDFIKMRTPTGDLNRKSLNLHHGVNITDDFLDAVDNDLDWCLVDPHSCEVTEKVKARTLWEEVITTRFRTGEPYINYLDEANDKLHPALKAKGLRIHGSNLCNEIHLPTDEDRTAVCCLSSVNLATYDEWKNDEYFIADLIEMLDNVLQFFIDHAPKQLHKAVNSAMMERSIGLGAMGFHDYLQSQGVPFESSLAISLNRGMFRNIKDKAKQATKELAILRGEAPDLVGYGDRNAHLLAIAPNANSSIILGVSPSIEPRASNCYTHKTRVGSYLVKNEYLEKVLYKYAQTDLLGFKRTEEEIANLLNDTWEDIMAHNGSVQHLDFLSDEDKAVFKTFPELDQRWVVLQARARQPYICQGQSVNLSFPVGADKAYVSDVHRLAFKQDEIGEPLKGLYYLRTEASLKTESVNIKIERSALQDGVQGETECIACQG